MPGPWSARSTTFESSCFSMGELAPQMPPLPSCWFVRSAMEAVQPATALPPPSSRRCRCRRRPLPTKHQIRSGRENGGGLADRGLTVSNHRDPLSFPPFHLALPPASGGFWFWGQIRVISRKIFCSESLKAFAAVP